MLLELINGLKSPEQQKSIVQLNSNGWSAEIAVAAGANLFSLRHELSGLELLRSPDSLNDLVEKPQMYGIPVLFPPNRIADGRFTWQGREYSFDVNEPECGNHLHGLILGKPWKVTEAEDNSLTMAYEFAAVSGFPHDFKLTMSYAFTPETVIQEFSIVNLSKQPMPFGLGFHTAFRLPPDAEIELTCEEACWEMNSRHLPTGRLLPMSKCVFRDDQPVSCHCPIAVKTINGKPFRGAIIDYPARSAKVYYEIDGKFRHWCLWNHGAGKGFFCPEPMTWMVNAPNIDLPPEITGMQSLEPGAVWKAESRIYVEFYDGIR